MFCSFLALILMKELQRRLADRGWTVEWDRLKDDLDELTQITVRAAGKGFVIRSVTRVPGRQGRANRRRRPGPGGPAAAGRSALTTLIVRVKVRVKGGNVVPRRIRPAVTPAGAKRSEIQL